MGDESQHHDPLIAEAIRLAGGLQATLAAAMGVRQQRVSRLLRREIPVTAADAIAIHRATGGGVPGSALRPDLWRRPEHVPVEPGEAGAAA